MAIITLGGDLGAGKTTVAKQIAETLGYEELYIGGILREMAAEKGLSIEDFFRELKNDPDLERSVDERQAKLMREKDNLVIQGRVAWYFARQSPFQTINFFLAVEPWIGAERQGERNENAGKSAEEIKILSDGRQKEERERYRMLYEIEDHLDRHHYDFTINTSRLTKEEVFACIMALIRLKLPS